MKTFPVFLRTQNRTAVVFGGGHEAAAKLKLALKTEARVILVAPTIEPDLWDLSTFQWVRQEPRSFEIPSDCAFAYAATGERTLDAEIAGRLREKGVLVCAVDQPQVSDFITPAIVDRDPVVVAIGTEGNAPVLARMIKARVESLLPARLGEIARAAGNLRGRVERTVAAGGARRKFWRDVLTTALDHVDGSAEKFLERFERRLAVPTRPANDQPAPGHVSIVGAGPGSADLLTLKACKLLDGADVVLHDALVAPDILELARREAITINVGKRCGKHSARQSEICALMVRHAEAGSHVVRLKGGDPSVFGRLAEEIDALGEAGISYQIVPGVTAAAAAAAAAAAPLTERELTQELRIITARSKNGEAPLDWRSIATSNAPLAVYMGKSVARDVQRQLILGGRDPLIPVVLVEAAGCANQRIYHATLEKLADTARDAKSGAPLMMLIGVKSRDRNATIARQSRANKRAA